MRNGGAPSLAIAHYAGPRWRVDGRTSMRRVSSLRALGEIDVLSADECDRVAEVVLDLRDRWIPRSPSGLFYTLGVNAYMDLAHAPDADMSYFTLARRSNRVLAERFAAVHAALAHALEREVGLPAYYADDLPWPGFHVWVGRGIPTRPGASIHFDLQYERLLALPRYARATGTVSFTLPVRLPAAGSSLRVWPGCSYPDDVASVADVRCTEPEVVPYRVGRALVHSGHVLHQVGVTPEVTPDDLRITLQGHGLTVDDALALYW